MGTKEPTKGMKIVYKMFLKMSIFTGKINPMRNKMKVEKNATTPSLPNKGC